MSDQASSGLSSRLAKLNPFKRSRKTHEADDEDVGEEVDSATVAGGGHHQQPVLRVSSALRDLLAREGVLGDDHDAGLQALLQKSHLSIPASATDRSHPLPEYFVSSSHNTYLMAHQLFGASSAGAYEATLRAGARCVEIDAWDNDDNLDEPKVTHGYTLVSNIPFRAVCETIRDVHDQEAAASTDGNPGPILLSLENHCGPKGQLRLVEIMREVWGDRLLAAPLRDDNHEDHVTLAELGSKIAVVVEHHIPNEASDSSSSSSSSSSSDESEDEKKARKSYKEKRKTAPPAVIIPELAALGIYAQSVKPSDSSWFSSPSGLTNAPHHHLINVSEVGLGRHLPGSAAHIARHNAKHLMRVFPKGTRISSANLQPVPFWGLGAQICALNWQTFGAGMQLNDALFSGTDGYVLKPAGLRAGGSGEAGTGRKMRLRLRVVGATDVPLPGGRGAEEIKPYVTCSLVQPGSVVKKKTGAVKQKSAEDGPVWDKVLEWEFEETELDFLRLFVKSDDSFASNPILAVAAVRLVYVVPGWSFVPMLDLKGHETKCGLLVKWEIEQV
ncbi:PLC-like phosphodiesterase [Podospora conica]|nr:PLC-like phosphodiesterase [Schizothecium conicum]